MKKFRKLSLCSILTLLLMLVNMFVYADSQRAETKGCLTYPSSMINILISEKTEESVEITEIIEKYETPRGAKKNTVKAVKENQKSGYKRSTIPGTGDQHALLVYLMILAVSGSLLSAIKYDRDGCEIS